MCWGVADTNCLSGVAAENNGCPFVKKGFIKLAAYEQKIFNFFPFNAE